MLHRTSLIFLIILSILLPGCQTVPSENPAKSNTPIQDPAITAKQLESQGKFLEAAREYQRLATTKPSPSRQHYQLSAIQNFLKIGKFQEAKAELGQLNIAQSFGLEIPLEFVRAKFDVLEHRVDKALERLRGIDSSTLPEALQKEYRQLHAEILAVQGKVQEAFQEWGQINRQFSKDPFIEQQSQQSIWQSLSNLNVEKLKKELQKGQDEVWSGWVALALLTKTVAPKRLGLAINDWSLRYPNHPGLGFAKSLGQQTATMPIQATQIVLLLPTKDSQYNKQAQAVREGFFQASYTVEEAQRPHVEVRQVKVDNVLQVYQEVVNEGADFVVGPLEKDALAVLANSQPILPVPTLGLNYLEMPVSTGNFYQFGLSPEDEAQQVALRAWQSGRRNPLVLVPGGDWGDRILKAFQREWEKHGGKLVSSLGYDDNFTASLKKFLKEQTTDMAFMVAIPEVARQMRPYFADALSENFPIYGTSHLYSGSPKSQQDDDLNGVMFTDMPWVLAPDEMGGKLRKELQTARPDGMVQFRRLYAFGIDAYNLLPHLQQLHRQSQFPWQGQTGRLWLNNKGEIHRDQMQWARFVNGVPQLLGND